MALARDCVFCRIVRGELPSIKVYEDDKVVVFLDIYPINAGHALVVPKIHVEKLEDLPEEYLERLLVVTAKVAPAIVKAVKAEAYNVVINNGRAAGQEVMHVHVHIIPRTTGDGCNIMGCRRFKPSREELERMGEEVRKVLSGESK